MGGAKRYPSLPSTAMMGFAALYPSYGLKTAAGPCGPDERSEIRGGVRGVPDFATLIRASV